MFQDSLHNKEYNYGLPKIKFCKSISCHLSTQMVASVLLMINHLFLEGHPLCTIPLNTHELNCFCAESSPKMAGVTCFSGAKAPSSGMLVTQCHRSATIQTTMEEEKYDALWVRTDKLKNWRERLIIDSYVTLED